MQSTLEEIEATIERMEKRYAHSILFGIYEKTCRRFEADLGDPRDLALSKAAALMLVKQFEGSGEPG